MKKHLTFLALLTVTALLAQNPMPIQEWQKHFGPGDPNLHESAEHLLRTNDGDYLLAGPWNGNQAFFMKVNRFGDSLWTQTFLFGTKTTIESCIETANGDLIAVGTCEGCVTDDPTPKIIVIKTDDAGQLLSNSVLGDPNKDVFGTAMIATSDGGVAITGYTSVGGLVGHAVHIFKLDQNLDVSWTKYYNNLYFDQARDIVQTSDGGFAITGTAFNFNQPSFVLNMRMDASGNFLWANRFSLEQNINGAQNVGNALQQADNGNLLVTGTLYNNAAQLQDLFVAEIDLQSGDTIRTKTFGTEYNDSGNDLQALNSGVLIAGTRGGYVGVSTAWVLHLNESWDTQKSEQYASNGFAAGANRILSLSSDGNEFAFCGQRNYWGAGTDILLVHRATLGNLAVLTKFPLNLQLYPRDLSNNMATVQIEGFVKNPDMPYTAMKLKVYRNNVLQSQLPDVSLVYTGDSAAFNFSYPILAELADYSFELFGVDSNGEETLEQMAKNVVAGDAYIIQGQSNAVSTSSTPSNPINQSPFVRVYGYGNEEGLRKAWYVGNGDGGPGTEGNTGQWGLRLARQIIDHQQVPVAILNGGHSGQAMTFFLPNAGNYERLLLRVEEAGLAQKIRAVFWFQGETDGWLNPNAAQYKSRFSLLHQAWMQDFSPGKTWLFQIRPLCFEAWGAILPYNMVIMETQRQLALEIPDLGIMSTTAVEHDGCHYPYFGGYETLGDRMYNLMAIDLYGSTDTANVEAPHPMAALKFKDSTTLVMTMENTTDELLWEDGSEDDFILEGTTDSVIGGSVSGNQLVLQLSGTAEGLTSISYTGHPITAIPFVKNLNGVGMLCFDKFPVDIDTVISTHETHPFSDINMLISPNPGTVGGELMLTMESAVSGAFAVQIHDMSGKLVKSQHFETRLDTSTYFFQAPATPGVFMVHILSKEGRLGVVKLVVQRT